jgi:dehydrogenase/reductase SDR family protein 12
VTAVPIDRIVDALLEATVVPSFSKIGPAVRRRVFDWEDPSADLAGRVAVVTGSSSGIGRVIATDLARMGATVWVTSRSQDRADEAAAEIVAGAGDGATIGHGVDMGELDQVRAFAARLRAETPAIDILVHNAGALTEERFTTSAGIEATVATHLVGPYLLTRELVDHLAPGARILFMSSGGMYTQGLTLRGLEMSESSYGGATAYARAKRAQVVLAGLLGEELAGRAVVHAMHPGWAATPGVTAGIPVFDAVMGPLLRTPEEAADTAVWLATADEPARTTGEFWHDRRRRGTTYLPGTATDPERRAELVPWLDQRIATADAVAAERAA